MYCICAFCWYIQDIVIILTLISWAQTGYGKLLVNLPIRAETAAQCQKIVLEINSTLFYCYLWYRGIRICSTNAFLFTFKNMLSDLGSFSSQLPERSKSIRQSALSRLWSNSIICFWFAWYRYTCCQKVSQMSCFNLLVTDFFSNFSTLCI